MPVHYTYGHVGEKLKLKLSCWVLALSDVHVWVSPSAFPFHIYCLCRPPCWVKQPHNQTQIIGAKGSWVGALVIYKHVGTYNTCTHARGRALATWASYIHTDTYTPPSRGNQHSSYVAPYLSSELFRTCWRTTWTSQHSLLRVCQILPFLLQLSFTVPSACVI